MHKLLLRQLKRNYPVKQIPEELSALILAVSEAYQDFENESALLERSLELVSDELNQRNEELKQRLLQLENTYRQLGDSMSVLDGIFDATGEAILAFDKDNRLVRFNQTAQEMLSLASSEQVYGYGYVIFLFSRLIKHRQEFFHELKKLKVNPETNLFGVIELRCNQLYEFHSTPQIKNEEIVGRVWCFRNVTQIKENEALVQYQAYHDALTELPNRVLLLDRINHAVALSQRNNDLFAILFIDLDHFKKVNDTEGHQVGDELLIEVSRRIRGRLREHDTLSRFGGDEFVVLLEGIKSHSVAAQTSQRIIEQLSIPFEIFNKQFHISASIGVSLYPRDDTDPQELIRKADLAMYHAKEQGRSNFEFFDSPLERLAHYQLELENKLRAAVANNELDIFYQPQVKTKDKSFYRVEALLRWFPPEGPGISPAEFVPIAERAGLISEIGYWLIESVCRQIKKWQQKSVGDICVSVNLSAKQVAEPDLVDRIRDIILKHQIPGECLEFEITESILMEDLKKTKKILHQLRALNMAIAIDDFGTGYSSLKYLQELPIDIIKIDRSFISDLLHKPHNQSIVKAIISLGHNLNLQIVAEGVENSAEFEFLLHKNCEYIQGFYFHRPMPAAEVSAILLGK